MDRNFQWLLRTFGLEGKMCLQAPKTSSTVGVNSFEIRQVTGIDREKARDKIACKIEESYFVVGLGFKLRQGGTVIFPQSAPLLH